MWMSGERVSCAFTTALHTETPLLHMVDFKLMLTLFKLLPVAIANPVFIRPNEM